MDAHASYLASIVVILIAARLFGEAALRLGQPAAIGQLIAGLALGPSAFGWIWPAAQHAIFPPTAGERETLKAFGDFGVLLLLTLTGMEVDLGLLRKIGRPAISTALAGIAVPLACGVALGLLLPESLTPRGGDRLPTALFLGAALSISSIKIAAAVVREIGFARRDIGQIMIASSIIEDSLGWILIAVILGVACPHGLSISGFAVAVLGVTLFLAASLTIGRRLVVALIRIVNDAVAGEYVVLSLIFVIVGLFALTTQAIGVQTVLGAFVAGVLIGESPILTGHIGSQLRGMVSAFFAPIFFALAGLGADLTILKSPGILALAVGLMLAATLGKFGGAFLGGAIGRLSRAESLALAVGMNARGATEVIVANVGVAVGALSHDLYSLIVTMAVATTCAMPPSLRWALARTPMRQGEKERLEREAFEASGFVANIERFLIAASDHANGRLASRLVGLLAGARGQPATVLHIASKSEKENLPADDGRREKLAADLKGGADRARRTRPEEAAHTPEMAVTARDGAAPHGDALHAEAPKGYDLLMIGADPAEAKQGGFNREIADMAREFAGPLAVAIARQAHQRDPAAALRILAPISGSALSRRGAEVAIELARAVRGELTILFVGLGGAPDSPRRRALAGRNEEAALKEIAEIAAQRDQPVRLRSSSARDRNRAILHEADKVHATLIVMGVALRPSEALLFGETANHLLEEGRSSLLFVAA